MSSNKDIKYLDKRILECPFNVVDEIKPHKKWIINHYQDHAIRQERGWNVQIDSEKDELSRELNNIIIPRFYDTIQRIFDVEEPTIPITNFVYIQNGGSAIQQTHNHIQSNTSIAGVSYIDVPDEGGEFQYYDGAFALGTNNFKRFKPVENKLYLFPGWMFHSPCGQIDMKPRICFNFEYVSRNRPIDMISNRIW